MDKRLIAMFNCEIGSEKNAANFRRVNEVSMKYGYIVHPLACSRDVVLFLQEQQLNTAATFYKEWEDITSKSRMELAIDQLRHYMSTYGAGVTTEGNGYVPNDSDPIHYTNYRVIMPATLAEVGKRICDMFYSGIALSSDTINFLMEFIMQNNVIVDIDQVKNKEVQAILAIRTGRMPEDEFGMLRVINYVAINSAMLIKSRDTLLNLKMHASAAAPLLNKLSNAQLKKLSRIFLRYKPIFLALKTSSTARVINKLRKLAKTNHTPMETPFWNAVLSAKDYDASLAYAKEHVGELNNFRKVVLLQGIRERLISKNADGKMFVIRNGKMFVRRGYHAPADLDYLMALALIIKSALIKSLSKKATTFKVMKGVDLTCPTSEKNFVGNYPFGTRVSIGTDHSVFGIYWRGEWGTQDFDLHYSDLNGNTYGWNSSYYNDNNSIIYSGDMTRANPEATEMMYLGAQCPDGIITVSRYYGSSDKTKFKLFTAVMNRKDFKVCNRYSGESIPMVDPNKIVAEVMIDVDGDNTTNVGYTHNGKIYLLGLTMGNGRVPNEKLNEIIHQQMMNKLDSFVDLGNILLEAGFTLVDNDQPAELDLTTPSKDVLIKLFA